MDYRGRTVVVTGASSGIGRRVALDFAARGTALGAGAPSRARRLTRKLSQRRRSA